MRYGRNLKASAGIGADSSIYATIGNTCAIWPTIFAHRNFPAGERFYRHIMDGKIESVDFGR
jgi:hypothetical protein